MTTLLKLTFQVSFFPRIFCSHSFPFFCSLENVLGASAVYAVKHGEGTTTHLKKQSRTKFYGIVNTQECEDRLVVYADLAEDQQKQQLLYFEVHPHY